MKVFSYIIVVVSSIYVLKLHLGDDLGLYINPRYIPAAVAAAVLGLFSGILGVWYMRSQLAINSQHTARIFALIAGVVITTQTYFGFILLLFLIFSPGAWWSKKTEGLGILISVISFGFLISPQALSSLSAARRSTNLNTTSYTEEELSTVSIFAFDSSKYEIGDWVKRINFDPDAQSYIGQKVQVTGFVFQPDDYPQDMFLISRFAITCCVVDARPIGLVVRLSDWQEKYRTDQWLEIEGEFIAEKVNEELQPIISPIKVTAISAPERPYIYLNSY